MLCFTFTDLKKGNRISLNLKNIKNSNETIYVHKNPWLLLKKSSEVDILIFVAQRMGPLLLSPKTLCQTLVQY